MNDDKQSPRQKLADDVRSHTIVCQTKSLPLLDYRRLKLVDRAVGEMIKRGQADKLALRHMTTLTVRFNEVITNEGHTLVSCAVIVDQYGGTTPYNAVETFKEYDAVVNPPKNLDDLLGKEP